MMIGPLAAQTALVLLLGLCWGQQEFRDNYHPQWESTGEVWVGDCDTVQYNCPPDKLWDCWHPPFCPYHPIEVFLPKMNGKVIGRSMVFWPNRFVNLFLGIPYAKPPVDERRFKPPEDLGPGWDLNLLQWDASFYRPACPQDIWELDQRFYEPRNTSEDCLYLNIFRPNITDRTSEKNKNYPVFFYIHGEDYIRGDAQLYPGHILAKKEVVVVTANYRLGALGFLSTLDDNAPGNYGIRDILKVLEYIQLHIHLFGGDPKKVTIVGGGSGSGIAGILMLSPLSIHPQYSDQKLFHRVILMSGSDLCDWAVVKPAWNVDARDYAKQLGRKAGCDPYYGLSMENMVECLRYKHYDDLVNASAAIPPAYGSLAGPFGPVVDGPALSGSTKPDAPQPVLPDSPQVIRRNAKNSNTPVMQVDILAGVNKDEGSYIVDEITKDMIGLNLNEGMDPGTFREIITRMMQKRSAVVRNVEEVIDAIEFEYTFWAKPDNRTAVLQNLIDLWTDMMYGWCVDGVLKNHATVDFNLLLPQNPVYMYVFDHRSEFEPLPKWMGVPHGKDVEYLFGFPFFNTTLGNLTNIVPSQWDWTFLDRNISEFVQDMWVNFTRYGEPTIEWTRNVSWYPFTLQNLSYLTITEFSYMEVNFRQNHYAFWREYFPWLAPQWPITTTPGPTPRPHIELQMATWSMVGLSLITLFIIGGLGITLWRRRRSPDEKDYY